MSWIQTRSGVAFDLLNPAPEMVRLEDIAYALARICRFTGHVPMYTVGQHSVHVSEQLYGPDAVVGLLHDAQEAYVGDVSRPLKGLLRDYGVVELRVTAVVFERFKDARGMYRAWVEGIPDAVKYADARILATEARDLMGPPPLPWEDLPPPYDFKIEPWPVEEAERRFLARAEELGIR